jgi:propanol-preferring alcohol dehydrogenase
MGYRVAAVDIGSAGKELCVCSGADEYFDALDRGTIAAIKALTPNEAGVKASIITAGSGKAYQSGLDMLSVFGTLVCVGIPPPLEVLSFHPLVVIDRGIRIIGTLVGTRTETLEALEFVRRGVVKPITNTIHLEDLRDLPSKLAAVRAHSELSPTSCYTVTKHQLIDVFQAAGKFVIRL